MKKLFAFLLTVLIGLGSLTLSAQQMNVTIVANGSETNNYLPFYGLWGDEAQHNQVIYNEGVMSDLIGSEIYGMTFFLPSTPSWAGQTFTIKLGIATPSSFSSPTYVNTPLTTVYTGPLTVTSDTMYIEFTSPFTYNGGNLLFDLTSTSGTWNGSEFYGITSTGGGMYAYGSNGPYVEDFLPKAKIYFTGGASCLSPQVGQVTNITDHAALFVWSPRANETTWEILLAPLGADITDSIWISVTDTTYSFTGLASNTAYTAYVRSDCGSETSGAMSINFTTDCDQDAIPFSQGFELTTPGALPSCWSTYPTYSDYPYVYDYNAYNSAHSLYCYQSTYNGNLDIFTILPKFDTTVALNTLFMRYMLLAYGEGTITVGAMTDPSDTATFTAVQSFQINGYGDEHQEYEVSFANYTGSGHYMVIRMQTYDYMSSYFDNFLVNLIPTCERPTVITVDSVTNNSVFFNWTPASSTSAWQVAIAPINDSLDENNLDWVAATDTTHMFDNLDFDTRYRLFVRANCGDEFSETRTIDFRTDCDIYVAPYQETFYGFNINPSPCWAMYNGLANSTVTSTSSLTPTDYGWYYYSGTSAVFPQGHPYCNVYGAYVQYWLVSPAIDLSQMTDPVLKFELALTTYNGSSPVSPGNQDDDRFIVMISTDDGATWSMANATIWSNTAGGDYVYDNIAPTGNDIYIPLTQYIDSTIRIAFYVESTEYNGDSYLRFYNVNVMETPECLRPETISVVTVGLDEATITWDGDPDEGNSWEVVLGTPGFTPDPDSVVTATTNEYTFYDLTPGTQYEVYVRTLCNDNSLTPWSNVFSFMTLSGLPAELPYFCGFEDAIENSAWTIVNGNNANMWFIGADSNAVFDGDSALYISNDSGTTNAYSITSNSSVWAYRDIAFPDGASEFHISINWKGIAEECCDYLKVFIGDPAAVYAGLSTAPSGATPLSGNLNNEANWKNETFVLGASYAGSVKRLYFLWYNDYSVGSNPPAAIDNITITSENCVRPTNLEVSNVLSDGATITITPGHDTDTEWEVMLVSDTTVTVTTGTLTFDVTNLTPATHYTLYARTICGSGDTSVYSLPVTFNTECVRITSVPVTWDFESNNIAGTNSYPLPACWTRQNGSYPYAYDYDYYAHSGNVCLYFYNYYQNRLVSMTEIDTNVLDISNLQISFYAALSSSYYGAADLVVGVMTDPLDASTFTPVDTVSISTNFYPSAPYEASLDGYTGHGSYIALMNSVGPDNYGSLTVDDITLEEIPLCSRPKDLTVVTDMNSADLSWTSNATAFTVYYRESGTSTWQTLNGVTTTSTTLTGLTAGTTYEWYVETACGGGSELHSSTFSFTTSICSLANQCTYTFNLSDGYGDGWNNGYITVYQNNIPVFVIEMTSGSSLTVPVNLCHGDSTTLVWTAGNYQDEASFVVLNPDGTALYSSPTMDNYLTPYTFVSDCGFGPVTTDPTVSTQAATAISQTGATLNGTITNPDNVTITAKGFEWTPLLGTDTTQVTVTGNVLTYDLTGLTPNTDYVFRAFITFNGTTVYGNGLIFTTLEQGQLAEPSATTLPATDVMQTTATLNGTIANPDNVTITAQGFEWKQASASNYTTVNATGATMTHNLTGLTANTPYTYRAFVTTANGTHYGADVNFTTQEEPVEPCDVPTGLHTTDIQNESVAIAWDANANVTSWNIQYKPVGGQLASASSNTNSYTITGLTGNTDYEIQIQAVCANGTSDWTSVLAVHTDNVGIENWLENSVSLYPNPAKEYVDIRVDGDLNVTTMEVYDVYGKLINTVNVVENPTRINVSNLANGMYFVRVTTEAGAVTKSFVKK